MIGADFKRFFFDSKAVVGAVDKTTRRVLSKFGAFVRRSAKSSIRRRRKASAPGQPPSSHTGLLKKLIFFGYEPRKRSVVIGPARLSQKIGDAPHALEHGGTSAVRRRGKAKRTTVAARPFMGPALAKEEPKLPAMWRDSVK